MTETADFLELAQVSKFFGSVIALKEVSFGVRLGEIHCLLGDNGAGKSTLIKLLSGVFQPTAGEIRLAGKPVTLASPRDALDQGVATVYQDLATVPLMSIARNFFMGREKTKGRALLRRLDWDFMNHTARDEMSKMGIDIRDPRQAVGTLSGGERQCLAIARAVHFGARILILDEPTSALGVHQASVVLRLVARAKARGLGVIFITHNVHHAYPIADRFTLLNRAISLGTFVKAEISRERVTDLMAGGKELVDLETELEAIAVNGAVPAGDEMRTKRVSV
ncbi:sugar ABC transporter ATP-binding protein [Nordella sp. HKS 07]|uniref:ATP-binding cassette domain-containing protein n=1 Tax=Nordella sp. HKS 07 TaxID=2712222 RepID=UPI0013E1F555|nr:ATP-binding cassette domain-containing protein [Nordella sp. HKS 07]QIG47741.1 sugar ABC transporter ATP-binding protein [Nordella sp. HKS 07]